MLDRDDTAAAALARVADYAAQLHDEETALADVLAAHAEGERVVAEHRANVRRLRDHRNAEMLAARMNHDMPLVALADAAGLSRQAVEQALRATGGDTP